MCQFQLSPSGQANSFDNYWKPDWHFPSLYCTWFLSTPIGIQASTCFCGFTLFLWNYIPYTQISARAACFCVGKWKCFKWIKNGSLVTRVYTKCPACILAHLLVRVLMLIDGRLFSQCRGEPVMFNCADLWGRPLARREHRLACCWPGESVLTQGS